MSTYRPKLYTASKIWMAPTWRHLRAEWSEIEFTSRWIDMDHLENPQPGYEVSGLGPRDFAHFWTIDLQDVKRSDFLLLYKGANDNLRGALVEAGMALGNGIPVLTVQLPANHSWACHPLVTRFNDLVEVRDWLKTYCVEQRK